MKKKLVFMILAASLTAGSLFGCTKTENTAEETKQEESSKTEKTEEKKEEETDKETTPEKETEEAGEDTLGIVGSYDDEVSGRATMEVIKDTGDQYVCMVNWSGGASETAVWTIKGTFDESTKTLSYKDGSYTIISWAEDGTETASEPETTEGSVTIEDGKLRWKDSKNSEDGLFSMSSGGTLAGVENPWTETDSIDEANEGAGVSFEPPVSAALPEIAGEKLTLVTYRYDEGIVEAQYSSKDHEMIIRKSNTLSEEELPGVFFDYPESWEENFKGLVVSCKGQNGVISVATYGVGDESYSIVCDPDEEASGLSADQVSSLIMGMQ